MGAIAVQNLKKKELKKKAVPEAGHLCVNFGDISD